MSPMTIFLALLGTLCVLTGCRPADSISDYEGPSAVQEVTSLRQFDQVMAEEEVVMVYYWASWCYPCQIVKPTIAEISNDYEQVTVLSVDVDEQGSLSQRYNVNGIPAVHIFKGGEPVKVLVGAYPRDDYASVLDSLVDGVAAADISEPSEEPVAEAEHMTEGG